MSFVVNVATIPLVPIARSRFLGRGRHEALFSEKKRLFSEKAGVISQRFLQQNATQ